MEKTILLKPRISEKTYMTSETTNTYVVEVPRAASKDMIAKAMTAQFNVVVKTVNVTNVKGKAKRTVRNGGRSQTTGHRSDFKKAYVTLAEGQKLPFFAEVEDTAKKADKADKKEKETK